MANHLRIGLIDVRDYAGIEHITIAPDFDTHFLLIAGENEQGKSSLLSAITLALSGKRAMPEMPVRRGQRAAQIQIDLVDADGGPEVYKLKLNISPDRNSKLEIRGPAGVVREPQTWLDRLLGAKLLDPIDFLRKDVKAQRAVLLEVAGIDTTEIDAEYAAAYAERTAVGRDLTRARGEHDSLPPAAARPAAARSVSVVSGELAEVESRHRQLVQIAAAATGARQARARAEAERDQARRALEAAQRAYEAAEDNVTAAKDLERTTEAQAAASPTSEGLDARRVELRAEMSAAETLGRWEAGEHQMRVRREQSAARVTEYSASQQRLTERLEALTSRKKAMLEAAALPVPGLAVGAEDDVVLLDGVPFSQASHARRLRVSMAITMHMAGGIRDIMVRDGAYLGERLLEDLRLASIEMGCWTWVERVGERDPGAIILREGKIATPDADVTRR